MSDLTEPILNKKDVTGLDENTKFNQFFVLDPSKNVNYFSKLIDLVDDNEAIYLISFYNTNYSVATIFNGMASVSVF